MRAETVRFEDTLVKVSDIHHMEFCFPYNEIIVAYLEMYDEKTGVYHRPEIADITKNTEGCLVIYDSNYCRHELYTEDTGEMAGGLLRHLAICAPYIFFNYQPWIDEHDEKEFAEIKEMVSVMRESFS